MRRIEYQDAEQYMPSTSLRDEADTRSTRAYPSLRDEAGTRSAPGRAIPIPIKDNRDEAATQSMRAYPSLRDEADTQCTPAGKKGDLKKQSQFVPGLSNVTSYLKGDYDKIPAGRTEKNKANQSQFPALEQTKGAGKREKSLAAVAG